MQLARQQASTRRPDVVGHEMYRHSVEALRGRIDDWALRVEALICWNAIRSGVTQGNGYCFLMVCHDDGLGEDQNALVDSRVTRSEWRWIGS